MSVYPSAHDGRSDGSYQKCRDSADEYGVSPLLTKWAAKACLNKFHCYGCLRLKESDNFDLTRFGPTYWQFLEYGRSLPSADDLLVPFISGEERLCLDCRLNPGEALKQGLDGSNPAGTSTRFAAQDVCSLTRSKRHFVGVGWAATLSQKRSEATTMS